MRFLTSIMSLNLELQISKIVFKQAEVTDKVKNEVTETIKQFSRLIQFFSRHCIQIILDNTVMSRVMLFYVMFSKETQKPDQDREKHRRTPNNRQYTKRKVFPHLEVRFPTNWQKSKKVNRAEFSENDKKSIRIENNSKRYIRQNNGTSHFRQLGVLHVQCSILDLFTWRYFFLIVISGLFQVEIVFPFLFQLQLVCEMKPFWGEVHAVNLRIECRSNNKYCFCSEKMGSVDGFYRNVFFVRKKKQIYFLSDQMAEG